MTAEIIIPEKEIADVKPGQKILVRSRAYPNMAFAGTVKTIASAVQGNSATAEVEHCLDRIPTRKCAGRNHLNRKVACVSKRAESITSARRSPPRCGRNPRQPCEALQAS